MRGKSRNSWRKPAKDEQAVRLRHLSRTPRDVQRAIPVSRQKHLLRSPTRCKQPGRKPVRCTGQNGSERDRQADGVEMDGIQPVSTTESDKVSSES